MVGAMAQWLPRSTPDRVVWVRTLAGVIVLRSLARLFTLTVPLSTQVYKWVPVNLTLGERGWATFDGLAFHREEWGGGVAKFLAVSCLASGVIGLSVVM